MCSPPPAADTRSAATAACRRPPLPALHPHEDRQGRACSPLYGRTGHEVPGPRKAAKPGAQASGATVPVEEAGRHDPSRHQTASSLCADRLPHQRGPVSMHLVRRRLREGTYRHRRRHTPQSAGSASWASPASAFSRTTALPTGQEHGARPAAPWISNRFAPSRTRPAPTAKPSAMASGRLRLHSDPLPEMDLWDAFPDLRGAEELASSLSRALERPQVPYGPRCPQLSTVPPASARR